MLRSTPRPHSWVATESPARLHPGRGAQGASLNDWALGGHRWQSHGCKEPMRCDKIRTGSPSATSPPSKQTVHGRAHGKQRVPEPVRGESWRDTRGDLRARLEQVGAVPFRGGGIWGRRGLDGGRCSKRAFKTWFCRWQREPRAGEWAAWPALGAPRHSPGRRGRERQETSVPCPTQQEAWHTADAPTDEAAAVTLRWPARVTPSWTLLLPAALGSQGRGGAQGRCPPESHLRRNCGATPRSVLSQGPGADVRPGCHRTPQLPGLWEAPLTGSGAASRGSCSRLGARGGGGQDRGRREGASWRTGPHESICGV